MFKNYIICFDFETTGLDVSSCQIIEASACVICPVKLEIIDEVDVVGKIEGSEGVDDSTIAWHARKRNVSPDEFVKYLIDNGLSQKEMWKKFTSLFEEYSGNSRYDLPIACGYNIINYDIPVANRYAIKYGPNTIDKRTKKKVQNLYSSNVILDLYHHMWFWFNNLDVGNNGDIKNLKLETLMDYMGYGSDGAHTAVHDTRFVAELCIKLLKLSKWMTSYNKNGRRRLEFRNAFAKVRT